MGEPMDRSGRVFYAERTFDEAFPNVEDADVEDSETGTFDSQRSRAAPFSQNPEQPERHFHSIRHLGGGIRCSNPLCRRGGFEIDGVLLEMKQSGEIGREGSVSFRGDEGSPKGQRRGKRCGNRVRCKLSRRRRRIEQAVTGRPGVDMLREDTTAAKALSSLVRMPLCKHGSGKAIEHWRGSHTALP